MINFGKKFEEDIKSSCKKTDFYYMRLVDSAKWLRGEDSKFTPENACDSILYTKPYMWMLELKSTKGSSISFYPNTPWEKPENMDYKVMIKPNQVKSLLEASEYNGLIAGFVFNFRERTLKKGNIPNVVYFVNVVDFVKYAVATGKSSINLEDCKKIGTEIDGQLKRTRYHYDIEGFVEKVIGYRKG